MNANTTRQLIKSLSKGLFTPDIDALRSFFAQDAKAQTPIASTFAQQQSMIGRLLGAGLIETREVAAMYSAEGRELRPTFITPRGQKLLDSIGKMS